MAGMVGMEGIGGNVTVGTVGKAGSGGAARVGMVGTTGNGGTMRFGIAGIGGSVSFGMAGMAGGAAAGSAVSRRWRAAKQVSILPEKTMTTRMTMAKTPDRCLLAFFVRDRRGGEAGSRARGEVAPRRAPRRHLRSMHVLRLATDRHKASVHD
ncbi:hypothetical protein BHE74_00024037 [Ensete ventricosum]|nr:hypothetical protein BHE74_00024037 [Ensete ventricosum]